MADWIVAIITAVISATAAIVGAIIGGKLSLKAARESFERAEEVDRETWRDALHDECVLNIRLFHEDPDGTWDFETRVLYEISLHAGALSPTDKYRIRRIKLAVGQVVDTLALWREERMHPAPGPPVSGVSIVLERLHRSRERAVNEIDILEQSLRRACSKSGRLSA